MRSPVSEPLIPLNAANLRIIPHAHKYFASFLQMHCKLIPYTSFLRSLKVTSRLPAHHSLTTYTSSLISVYTTPHFLTCRSLNSYTQAHYSLHTSSLFIAQQFIIPHTSTFYSPHTNLLFLTHHSATTPKQEHVSVWDRKRNHYMKIRKIIQRQLHENALKPKHSNFFHKYVIFPHLK